MQMTNDMKRKLNQRERAAHEMNNVAHKLAQIADVLLELNDPDAPAAKRNSEAAAKFAGKLEGKYSNLYRRYSDMLNQ